MNLSIRTDKTDKTVEQSGQGLHCLSFYLLHLHMGIATKTQTVQF